jgi:hypothetical protein
MELLLGAVVALATQLLKRFTNKFGSEWSLIVAFIFTVGAVVIYRLVMDNSSDALLEEAAKTMGIAIGWYEIILKRVPVIGKQD